MSEMKNGMVEFMIGKIAKEILLKRIKELNELGPDAFEARDIAAFEKYTKLYLALVDDWRKNFDDDLARIEKAKKTFAKVL